MRLVPSTRAVLVLSGRCMRPCQGLWFRRVPTLRVHGRLECVTAVCLALVWSLGWRANRRTRAPKSIAGICQRGL